MFTKQFLMMFSLGLLTLSYAFGDPLDDQLEKEAKELNRKLPQITKSKSIVDYMAYHRKTRTLNYVMLMEVDPQKVSDSVRMEFKTEAEIDFRGIVCTSADARRILEKGVKFRYSFYTTRKYLFLCNVLITKEDCPK